MQDAPRVVGSICNLIAADRSVPTTRDMGLISFRTTRQPLDMKRPADHHTCRANPNSAYPTSNTRCMTANTSSSPTAAFACTARRSGFTVLVKKLGPKMFDDGIRLTSFMHDDLGYIDLEQRTLQPINNPFGSRLSAMFLGIDRHPSVRYAQVPKWRRGWDSNPRYTFTVHNGLANRRLQPLGHPSVRLVWHGEVRRAIGQPVSRLGFRWFCGRAASLKRVLRERFGPPVVKSSSELRVKRR